MKTTKYLLYMCVIMLMISLLIGCGHSESDRTDLPKSTEAVLIDEENYSVKYSDDENDDTDEEISQSESKSDNSADDKKAEVNTDTGVDKTESNTENKTTKNSVEKSVNQPSPMPTAQEETLACTLSVRCDTALKNQEKLDKKILDILPKNGIIFQETTVKFEDGDSVFDVLLREMKENKIHLEYVDAPLYSGVYVEGIANLYEFDCGELSGWTYRVNGEFPSYSCSVYKLKEGDKIEWIYTCELGKDIQGE